MQIIEQILEMLNFGVAISSLLVLAHVQKVSTKAKSRFTWEESVSSVVQIKSSAQRGIRSSIVQQYPGLEQVIDDIWPKKAQMMLVKWYCNYNTSKEHLSIYTVNNEFLFFNHYDGPFFPCLRLLHKYPDMMIKYQVDRGAIKFVLSGADIMCPGLTSPGARLPSENVPENTPVAIYAEGKEHAVAIGLTKMSLEEIKSVNKGIGVENVHVLLDGLWNSKMDL